MSNKRKETLLVHFKKKNKPNSNNEYFLSEFCVLIVIGLELANNYLIYLININYCFVLLDILLINE